MERKELRTQKKLGNKGFSLIELIIVIAIMAILVGIVGTQVVPYIEKSRRAKDEQIASAICTAMTSAVSGKAAAIDTTKDITIIAKSGDNGFVATGTTAKDKVGAEMARLLGTTSVFPKNWESKVCKEDVQSIKIYYNGSTGVVEVTLCNDDSGASPTPEFETIKSTTIGS